jgi:hypothetical protein
MAHGDITQYEVRTLFVALRRLGYAAEICNALPFRLNTSSFVSVCSDRIMLTILPENISLINGIRSAKRLTVKWITGSRFLAETMTIPSQYEDLCYLLTYVNL